MQYEPKTKMYLRTISTVDVYQSEIQAECDVHGSNPNGEYRQVEFKPLRNDLRFWVFRTSFSPPFTTDEFAAFFGHGEGDASDYLARLKEMPRPTSFVQPSPFRRIFGDQTIATAPPLNEVPNPVVYNRVNAFRVAASANRMLIESGVPFCGPYENWATVFEQGCADEFKGNSLFSVSFDEDDIGAIVNSHTIPIRLAHPTDEQLARYAIDWDSIQVDSQ